MSTLLPFHSIEKSTDHHRPSALFMPQQSFEGTRMVAWVGQLTHKDKLASTSTTGNRRLSRKIFPYYLMMYQCTTASGHLSEMWAPAKLLLTAELSLSFSLHPHPTEQPPTHTLALGFPPRSALLGQTGLFINRGVSFSVDRKAEATFIPDQISPALMCAVWTQSAQVFSYSAKDYRDLWAIYTCQLVLSGKAIMGVSNDYQK